MHHLFVDRRPVCSVVLTAVLSLGLLACEDSSSGASEDPVSSSSKDQSALVSDTTAEPASSAETDSLKYLDYYGTACSADEEGLYKTGKHLKARYPDGSVWDEDRYYQCVSGKWTYSENPGPEEKCTAELDGEIQEFMVGNAKYHTYYYYQCKNGSWGSISDPHNDVNYMCTKPDTQVGDTCLFTGRTGAESAFGWYAPTKKYVYSEEGEWVYLCTYSDELVCEAQSSDEDVTPSVDEVCQKFESKEGTVCTVTGCDWNVPASSQPRCYADDYVYSEKEGNWVKASDYDGDVSVAEVISLMGAGTIPIACDEEGKVVKLTRDDYPSIYDLAADSSLDFIYGKCVGGVYRHSSEEK